MSSQARKDAGQPGQVASKDDESVAGCDDEPRVGGGSSGSGHGWDVVPGAGSGRRDNVPPPPSLQPPMAVFKVASVSQG